MDGLKAEETLREKGGELSARALHRLVLEATGSEKAAEEAFHARRLDEMRRDVDAGR